MKFLTHSRLANADSGQQGYSLDSAPVTEAFHVDIGPDAVVRHDDDQPRQLDPVIPQEARTPRFSVQWVRAREYGEPVTGRDELLGFHGQIDRFPNVQTGPMEPWDTPQRRTLRSAPAGAWDAGFVIGHPVPGEQ